MTRKVRILATDMGKTMGAGVECFVLFLFLVEDGDDQETYICHVKFEIVFLYSRRDGHQVEEVRPQVSLVGQ